MKTSIKFGFFSFSVLISLFGLVFADTSGSLFSTMSTQKTVVENLYDTSYQNVYKQFQSSVASVVKSLNYQSLVCLGVMSDTLFLQQMQTDSKNLKLGFLNAYSRIQTDLMDVEQKHRIELDTNLSLFVSGTSYESELARLSSDLTNLVSSHTQLAQQFQQSYQSKISSFLKDVSDYTEQNKSLVATISSKLLALQTIDQKLQSVSANLFDLQAKLAGTGTQFFDKISKIKAQSLDALSSSLQDLIDFQVKRTKILTNLSGELATQKAYALGLFGMQYDEKLNAFLSQWYDNKEYSLVQSQVSNVKQAYFLNNKYQCQNIINDVSFDSTIASLNKQLDVIALRIQSGSTVVKTNSGAAVFQTKVLQWFSTVDQDQKKSITTFKTVIQQKTSSLLQAFRDGINQSQSTGVVVEAPSIAVASGFSFKSPFTSNQKHPDIVVLQKLLIQQGYYTGAADGVYTKSTKNAVYQLQLAYGLLKGYEKKPQTWGWMGPATRVKLNQLLYKN